ncbi:MAG: hypothetical protein K6T83_11545 [Alicyclobacillus sp.]|nr:hypothetical protein [Alicyclobacillus sp.]
MEDDRRQQNAQFRYEVIAPLLHGPEKGSLQAALGSAAQRTYRFPDGTERRLSVLTLERYLSLYRRGGSEALYPAPRSDRSRRRALPQAVIERAIALRKEQPALVQMLQKGDARRCLCRGGFRLRFDAAVGVTPYPKRHRVRIAAPVMPHLDVPQVKRVVAE